MPRTKKETLIEKDINEVKNGEKVAENKTTAVKNKATKKTATKKVSSKKATVSSRTATKKATTTSKTTAKKATATTKTTAKKATATSKTTAKKATTTSKTAAKKATTTSKTIAKKSTAKEASKKDDTSKKATATKKTASKKSTTSRSLNALAEFGKTKPVAIKKSKSTKTTSKAKKLEPASTKTSSKVKQTRSKSASTKATTLTKNSLKAKKATLEEDSESLVSTTHNNIVEYYDLPYRYNQTVVKVLAQNPNTLFAYWDVSDEDIENLKKQYGENFLYITRPVLLVHNLTENYSFEIEIDDFANNWYIHVDNAKCEYSVELCRRPNQSDKIQNVITNKSTDFINISYSNTIEMPNDRILFFKDNQKIYFKNIKTNKITQKIYNSDKHGKKLKAIYSNYNLSENEDRFDFKNPSSQNPTSNVM